MIKKLLAIITLSFALIGVANLPQSTVRVEAADCDDNAVIRCGVVAANVVQKCQENQGGNVQAVFQHFGIADCGAALSGMVAGEIGSDNKVYVGGQVVATNAVTVGRQNMPGSTPILGGAFYQRSPNVSFQSSRLAALVKLEGDVFKYAIIESCGNPVKATPTAAPPQPQPQPAPPQPPQPQPQPKPPVPQTPAKASPPQPQPTVLAETGPASVLGIGGSVSIAGYAGSLIYRRLRQKYTSF